MNSHRKIIPITYLGGTGARFLTYFLTCAKLNKFEEPKLSEHGSAHFGLFKELGTTPWGIEERTSAEHIEWIESKSIENYDEPLFVTAHILDLDLALEHFDKVIRLTYDEDDMDEINHVFLGKFGLDDFKIKKTPNEFLIFRMPTYIRLHPNFTRRPELEPRVLFVSWKEMYHYDLDVIITKLHHFTEIPKNNFNADAFNHWRNVTRLGVEHVKSLVEQELAQQIKMS